MLVFVVEFLRKRAMDSGATANPHLLPPGMVKKTLCNSRKSERSRQCSYTVQDRN